MVLLVLNGGDPSHLNTAEKNVYNPATPHRSGKVLVEFIFHEEGDREFAAPWGSLCGQTIPITPQQLEAIPNRRVFKSHLRPHLLPGLGDSADCLRKGVPPPLTEKGVKFIHVIRDPKDVAVSLYRVNALNLKQHGFPFVPYIKLFLQGNSLTGEYWPSYIKEWLAFAEENPQNVLILTYEDNLADPGGALQKIATFLNVELTDVQLENCIRFSSFEYMKGASRNAKVEHVHNGIVGDGAQSMSGGDDCRIQSDA